MNALVINVAELLREPGSRKHLAVVLPPGDVDVDHPAVTGDLTVDVVLTSSLDDVVVAGTAAVPWHGACRRCLREIDCTLGVALDERYTDDAGVVAAGEAVPIVRDQVDLRDLVRDEVLLAADEERLCRDDCAGLCPTCGADRNEGRCGCPAPAGDERWSVLDQLRRE